MPIKTYKESFEVFLDFICKYQAGTFSENRHEAYYIALHRSKTEQLIFSFGALVRDCLYWCLPRELSDTEKMVSVVVLVSAEGSSGWKSIEPSLNTLSELDENYLLVRHFKMKKDKKLPRMEVLPNLSFINIIKAIKRGLLVKASSIPEEVIISRWMLKMCMIRGNLYKMAWRSFFSSRNVKAIIMHNDFEMFSVAACHASCDTATSICIQHGIPTDEFFPTIANKQIVWGESSKEAYISKGVEPKEIIVDSLGRGGKDEVSTKFSMPESLFLVSQTHTSIYGIDLRKFLPNLAKEIQAQGLGVRVLLHPNENYNLANELYGPVPIEAYPHADLMQGAKPALIIGYSSTALLQAAMLGHYVVGVGPDPLASKQAYNISCPPRRVEDVEELVYYFRQLKSNSKFRHDEGKLLEGWIKGTYHLAKNEEGLTEYLREQLVNHVP